MIGGRSNMHTTFPPQMPKTIHPHGQYGIANYEEGYTSNFLPISFIGIIFSSGWFLHATSSARQLNLKLRKTYPILNSHIFVCVISSLVLFCQTNIFFMVTHKYLHVYIKLVYSTSISKYNYI